MSTDCSNDSAPVRSDGISRREVLLRVGAGGLAVALLANGIEAVSADEATPASVGMPAGVGATQLAMVPITEMPATPFAIVMKRITLEPGAVIPNSAIPNPSFIYVEAGEGLVCPFADEGRVAYEADGTVMDSGGGEFAMPVGTSCYTSPNSADGIRNDGPDQASFLNFELVPSTEGTPTP